MTGERAAGTDTADGLPIRRRAETDGCSCLDCRNVDAATTRRSVLDTVQWSLGLCRAYPSILLFGVCLVTAGVGVDALGARYLPSPVVRLLDILMAAGFVLGLRAYVATLTARELTGSSLAPWPWCRRAIVRTLLLAVVVLALVFVIAAASTALTFALFGALVVGGMLPPGGPLHQPGFLAAVAVSVGLLLVPVFYVLFKCWFALEACIIGRYGPVDAIRVSWGLTTTYRGKVLRLTAVVILSLGASYVAALTPSVSGPLGTLLSSLGPLVGALGELTAVLWYAVSAHLYVQGVLDA
ncbi:hypothetical protein [Haloarcula salinisoli]|uniref:Uncharacterized protein n=1 Tax=Haloarcula salinisoli TaxID=2487746 RepID=A0A8J7YAF0_9EURY|nr:hypothetical protein [Halomicroarcula salinisoli]MBX0286082.1 hypothetical protein [Halomicroarcula salinisoli]MBX0302430.1 hypothetical protein [Halomicroarcula salinisoli]